MTADPKLAAAELACGHAVARRSNLDSQARCYLIESAVAFSKANRADGAVRLLCEFHGNSGALAAPECDRRKFRAAAACMLAGRLVRPDSVEALNEVACVAIMGSQLA